MLLLNGVVRAFNGPAAQALMPSLVGVEHFPNAVTWGSSSISGSDGAGAGGGRPDLWDRGESGSGVRPGWSVLFSAVVLLSMIHTSVQQRPRGTASVGIVLEGLRFIWRNKLVLGAISLDLFAVLLGGAVALLPVYAKEILRVGATG